MPTVFVIWQRCMHPKLMLAGMENKWMEALGSRARLQASFTDLTDSCNSSRAVKLEAKDYHDARVMQTCCLHFRTRMMGLGPIVCAYFHVYFLVSSTSRGGSISSKTTLLQ